MPHVNWDAVEELSPALSSKDVAHKTTWLCGPQSVNTQVYPKKKKHSRRSFNKQLKNKKEQEIILKKWGNNTNNS